MSTPKISRARVGKRRDRPTFFFVLAICLLAGAIRSTKSGVSANSGADKLEPLRESTTRGESLGRTSTAVGVEDEETEVEEESEEEGIITTAAPKEEVTATTTTASIAAANKSYSPFASITR